MDAAFLFDFSCFIGGQARCETPPSSPLSPQASPLLKDQIVARPLQRAGTRGWLIVRRGFIKTAVRIPARFAQPTSPSMGLQISFPVPTDRPSASSSHSSSCCCQHCLNCLLPPSLPPRLVLFSVSRQTRRWLSPSSQRRRRSPLSLFEVQDQFTWGMPRITSPK